MNKDIINNVDIDSLPEFLQNSIIKQFSNLSLKEKLIIYSKLTHGHLYKVTTNDLFNINKHTPNTVYRKFINNIKKELKQNEEIKKRSKHSSKRYSDKERRDSSSKKIRVTKRRK